MEAARDIGKTAEKLTAPNPRRKNNPPRTRRIRPSMAIGAGTLMLATGLTLAGQEATAAIKDYSQSAGARVYGVGVTIASAPFENLPIVHNPPKNHPQEIAPIINLAEQKFTDQDVQKIMAEVPMNLKEDAKVSIPLIIQALREEKIDSKAVLAFTLGNAEWETWFDFEKEEFGGREQARKLKYEGGDNYFARGLGAITHKPNYKRYGDRLHIDLENNPDLALKKENSGRILGAFTKDEGIADLVNQGKLVEARKRFVGNYADDDEHNKSATRYILLRTKAYENQMR